MPSRNEKAGHYILLAFAVVASVALIDIGLYLAPRETMREMMGWILVANLCFWPFHIDVADSLHGGVVIGFHFLYTLAVYTLWVGFMVGSCVGPFLLATITIANVIAAVLVPACVVALVIASTKTD